MLSFLTQEHIRSNQQLLGDAARSVSGISVLGFGGGATASEGRAGYFAALNTLQAVTLPLPQSRWPEVWWQQDDDRIVDLLAVLGLEENWADHASTEDLREARAHMESALKQLNEVDQAGATDFGRIVSTLIAVVVFAGDFSGGGMSEGHNLGLVCVGMGARRLEEVTHFAETLIHEATHQGLFLDDMLYRVFQDEARGRFSDHPLEAYSTTRSTRRPYDVAFHAACVTATLEMFRVADSSRKRPSAEIEAVMKDLVRSVEDLSRSRERALTTYGQGLLDELVQICEQA